MAIMFTLIETFLIKIVAAIIIVHSIVLCEIVNEERFQFPEFDYKETTKNVSFDTKSIFQFFKLFLLI